MRKLIVTVALFGGVVIAGCGGGGSSTSSGSFGAHDTVYTAPIAPGYAGFIPAGINDSGEIVGTFDPGGVFTDPGGVIPLPSSKHRASVTQATDFEAGVISSHGTQFLGDVPGQPVGTSARAIAPNGDIAGICGFSINQSNAPSAAFLYSHGKSTVLEAMPDGAVGVPAAINNSDEVVGTAKLQPAAWINGTPQYLPLPTGSGAGSAVAVNSGGMIVGYAYIGNANIGNSTEAVIWSNSGVTVIDAENTFAKAVAVNDHGEIVGNDAFGPFVWQNGQITRLTTPSGYGKATATAINNNGLVVGEANVGTTTQTDIVAWKNGQFVDVTTATGFSIEAPSDQVLAVNDLGEILVLQNTARVIEFGN